MMPEMETWVLKLDYDSTPDMEDSLSNLANK